MEYYIDMELFDLNLDDYIKGKRSLDLIQSTDKQVFIRGDPPLQRKMQNVWTIMSHIADGLKYIHKHKYVHRDLKPKNGTFLLLRFPFNADCSPMLTKEERMEDH